VTPSICIDDPKQVVALHRWSSCTATTVAAALAFSSMRIDAVAVRRRGAVNGD
jgi:hypothetical protein